MVGAIPLTLLATHEALDAPHTEVAPVGSGPAVEEASSDLSSWSKLYHSIRQGLGPVSYTHLTLPTNREV